MRLFAKPNYEFMKYRRFFITASLVLNVIGLGVFFTKGLNYGIEFTGGTELSLKFAQSPDLGEVRAALEREGLRNPSVTTLGDPAENELYIRVAAEGHTPDQEPAEAGAGEAGRDLTRRVVGAVRGDVAGKLDLNLADTRTITTTLQGIGVGTDEAARVAEAIRVHRERQGMLAGLQDLRGIQGVTPELARRLEEISVVGPVAIRAQNYVGPSIAPELRKKAVWAVLGSILAMLAYIGFRFRFQWGLGAILAVIHDVIVTIGIYSLTWKEFSLPVVASFLTLVGYSTNDTIVVFDRIRENLRLKGSTDLVKTINASINQTLSRTIITSFLTWIVCVALWLFGGEPLNGFSFVLVIGIIIGTYSSIYIASPVIIFWEWLFEKRKIGKPLGGISRR